MFTASARTTATRWRLICWAHVWEEINKDSLPVMDQSSMCSQEKDHRVVVGMNSCGYETRNSAGASGWLCSAAQQIQSGLIVFIQGLTALFIGFSKLLTELGHWMCWGENRAPFVLNNNKIIIIIIIIIITAYTAAFPQSGSSSAGIQVISACDIGQAFNTGEIPLFFSRSAVGSLKPPYWVSRGWETRSTA